MNGNGNDNSLSNYSRFINRKDPRGQHDNKRYLPSRDEIHEIVELLLELFYPGYYGRQDLTDENLPFHVGTLLSTLREKLERQIETCLCFARETEGGGSGGCSESARRASAALLARLPAIRDALILDVQAANDGDPAAQSLDEVILAYPGFRAITVHRVAHELYRLGVPLSASSRSGRTARRVATSTRAPRSAREILNNSSGNLCLLRAMSGRIDPMLIYSFLHSKSK